MAELKITSIETLKSYAEGEIVELPPFSLGQPFVARLKRPSMMMLMKAGKIPNKLLVTANALFNGTTDSQSEEDSKFVANLFGVLEVIAEASLLEPTMDELKKAGVQLTDEQYMFIFNYSQRGVKALDSFREQPKNFGDDKPVENV